MPLMITGVGLRSLVGQAIFFSDSLPVYANVKTPWGYLNVPSQAPECLLGQAPDAASDVYALGILGATFCEMTGTGEPGGIGDSYARCTQPLELLSHPLKPLLVRLCAFHREERPTMQDVACACREALSLRKGVTR
jgi:hypothetical protein